MDSTSTPSITGSFVRGKCDPAWSHVLEEVNDGKSSFKCLYCGKVYNRIKNLFGLRIIISIMYYKMTIETCLMLSNEHLTFFVVWM